MYNVAHRTLDRLFGLEEMMLLKEMMRDQEFHETMHEGLARMKPDCVDAGEVYAEYLELLPVLVEEGLPLH